MQTVVKELYRITDKNAERIYYTGTDEQQAQRELNKHNGARAFIRAPFSWQELAVKEES